MVDRWSDNRWTVTDGAGLVHSVVFPGFARWARHTRCGRTYSAEEVRDDDAPRTCFQCIVEEVR